MSADISPDDYRLNARQKHINVICIACVSISAIFVGLRCYVRAYLQRQFSADDWLLVLGLIGFIITAVFVVRDVTEGGFGRKSEELPLSVFYTGIKYLVMNQTSFVLTMLITKLSIALLQLRIIGPASKLLRQTHYVSIAVNIIMGIYEFFALLFQCSPPEKFWTPSITGGHCASRQGVATGVYIYSAVNLALDWYYALALIPVIWRLQMRTAVKLSTTFILSLGVFASIANIIRLRYVVAFTEAKEQLYNLVPVGIWCWVELCLGTCAACATTLRPLVRSLALFSSDRDGRDSSSPINRSSSSPHSSPSSRHDSGFDAAAAAESGSGSNGNGNGNGNGNSNGNSNGNGSRNNNYRKTWSGLPDHTHHHHHHAQPRRLVTSDPLGLPNVAVRGGGGGVDEEDWAAVAAARATTTTTTRRGTVVGERERERRKRRRRSSSTTAVSGESNARRSGGSGGGGGGGGHAEGERSVRFVVKGDEESRKGTAMRRMAHARSWLDISSESSSSAAGSQRSRSRSVRTWYRERGDSR